MTKQKEELPVGSVAGAAELLKAAQSDADERALSQVIERTDPVTGEVIAFELHPGGDVNAYVQDNFERRRPNPRFRRGVAKFTTLQSFVDHIGRFGDPDSAVFANFDPHSPSVTSVLDYHRVDTLPSEDGEGGQGEFRHCRHRGQFDFPVSDELKAWKAADKEKMSMAEFAAFLENHVLDVAEVDAVPASAAKFVDMMGGKNNIADWSALTKLSRSLTVYENGHVDSKIDLSQGKANFTIKEDYDTEVEGVKVDVPTMFFIDVPIFKDGVKYRIAVRLRFRKSGGTVIFFYELWGMDRAFKDAFDEAIQTIRDDTTAQVFYGTPEA